MSTQPTWSRVDEGFFVASVAGDFLGFIDRDDAGFSVYGSRGDFVTKTAALAEAMDALSGRPTSSVVGDAADGQLVSMTYTSIATRRFDDERLAALLAESRDANADRDVTGMLLYRESRFLQVLEGPQAVVHDLLERIRLDRRHHDVRVLSLEFIGERRFEDWSMGYRPWSTPAGELPAGFRDAFADLAAGESETDAVRAARELITWFQYRAED